MKTTKFFTLFLTVSIGVLLGTSIEAQPTRQAAPAQQQNQKIPEDSKYINPANPSPFEAMPGELITEEIDSANLTDEQKAHRDRNIRTNELWKNADYRNYDHAFSSLYKLSKAFTNNKYRLALSAYQSGVNTIIKLRENEEDIRKEGEEKTRLNEKWYWQVIDRKAQEDRLIGRLRRKSKIQAVIYFTRAIFHLDEISNKELRGKSDFKRLLSAVYRNWVMYQFDLGNLPQCIPVLELYLQIDENEKEYSAHKYLSQCYAFQENALKKYKNKTTDSDDELFRYRYKKNVHLLRATELKYGKDSGEYKHIINVLNRDEIIAVQN